MDNHGNKNTAYLALRPKFIYHVDYVFGVHYLCIPTSVASEIITIAHGKGHSGFAQCHEIVSCSWYIRNLIKLLRAFIHHCSQCLQLQIRKHPPYGFLQLINSLPILFHTFTLDFVLALSLSAAGFNLLMSITYKFLKWVTLVESKNIWSARNWAYALLRRLNMIDWGLPSELITNKNPKFVSNFCKALFIKLGMKLLYSTAYQPQTNRSSKRINQIVEIALRFFIHALEDPVKWPKVLPQIQTIFNNTSSSTIGKTPNEVAYSFSPRCFLNLLSALSLLQPLATRAKASNAIFFAMSNQKLLMTGTINPYLWK